MIKRLLFSVGFLDWQREVVFFGKKPKTRLSLGLISMAGEVAKTEQNLRKQNLKGWFSVLMWVNKRGVRAHMYE